ncbi:MAG TPA: glycosyltransferase [Burkholderiales bacterium]|nr:glycosyltransferase [Burkholderiales bacterium]
MRLLHVISSADPAGGGPIEGIKQLARAVAKRGAVVHVASLDDPTAPWIENFPLTLHALGPATLRNKWLRYSYAARLVPWLRKHVEYYDAVVINGIWQYHAFGVWQVLRRSRIPYFVFTHGMLDPWFKRAYPLKHLKKWLYWPWADYRVLRDASAVLFTCEDERVLARRSFWLYRCREVVVGYGTAVNDGNADVQREAFLREFPALRDKRLVLFISRIHPKKGCDLLIEAFSRVANRDAALHLVMAGPDQVGWKQALIAQAEALGVADRITWTGMLSGDVKWGAYRAADVFVLPSHQENFGIVVAEALACGLPVLISNKVNIWREIEMDGAGAVADDDLAGTAALLQRWLDTGSGDMKQRALECFRRRFEIHAAADRFLATLQTAQREEQWRRLPT